MAQATAHAGPTTAPSKAVAERKVFSALYITLDGVTESPEKWQFDSFNDEIMAAMEVQLAAEDTILLGRGTYEAWMHYWPTSNAEPYASHINNTPKVVVSRSLDHVEWGQWDTIRLVEGSVADELARLKRQPGKNIGVAGSPSLVRSLLQDGLLDELILLVHPVIAGSGKRLFPGESDLQRMNLVGSQITRTGVALLTYQPRRNA